MQDKEHNGQEETMVKIVFRFVTGAWIILNSVVALAIILYSMFRGYFNTLEVLELFVIVNSVYVTVWCGVLFTVAVIRLKERLGW